MDHLIEAIESKQNPSVVGLDPTPALVPAQVMGAYAVEAGEYVEDDDDNLAATGAAAAYFEFNRAIIDAVADIVPPSNHRLRCMRRSGLRASTAIR